MKKFFTLFLFVFAFTAYSQAQDKKLKQLDSYLKASFEQWHMPGMAVAVVQDGKIVYQKGFGYLDWSKKKKANPQTLYPIGSISKSFTALALAQLVEEGKIDWKDKVKKYIPGLELYDRYVTDNITIEDLLCHRAGYATFSGDLLWYRTDYSVDDIIPRIKYLKPEFGFRDGFGYSNIMFLLAGKVVENVSGMTWQQYVAENIFSPLNMQHSNTNVDLLKTDKNFAPGCMVSLDGKEEYVDYIPSGNIGAFGGINSSVADLANYMIMYMNGGVFNGKKVIDKKEIEYLWQVHNPLPVGVAQKNLHPTRHFYGYGLGWFVYDQNGYKVVTHSGGMDGALSKLVMIPELNTGFVILTNSNNFIYSAMAEYFVDLFTGTKDIRDWNEFYLQRFKYYQDSYVRMKERHKRVEGTKPSLPLEKYAGVYHDKMYGDVQVIYKDGKLSLHFVPAPYLDASLTHWHYDVFELHFKNNLMAIPTQWGLANFVLNEDGQIVKLRLTVPNYDFLFQELEFEKVK